MSVSKNPVVRHRATCHQLLELEVPRKDARLNSAPSGGRVRHGWRAGGWPNGQKLHGCVGPLAHVPSRATPNENPVASHRATYHQLLKQEVPRKDARLNSAPSGGRVRHGWRAGGWPKGQVLHGCVGPLAHVPSRALARWSCAKAGPQRKIHNWPYS